MKIFDMSQSGRSGFTIVELIVVIAVIGILASITIIAYPNYQRQSRDSQRKSDIDQIVGALGVYAFQKNSFMETGSGCGINGNGNGWLSVGPGNIATYPKSIVTCLQEIKALPAGTFADPTDCLYDSGGECGSVGGDPVRAYMKATCTKSGAKVTYVFAHLENEPRKDAEVDALCDDGTVSGFDAATQKWGTRFGMNYYARVK